MANPGGENGQGYLGGMGGETAYGAVKRMEESLKAAPIGPTPGLAAPKTAQRRAVRGKTQQSGPTVPGGFVPPPSAAPSEPSPDEVWQALAADPDASPLVREYAAQVGDRAAVLDAADRNEREAGS